VSMIVVVWRLVKGWRTYAHLLMFALPWPSLLIVGHTLAELPIGEAVLRSLGGTALFVVGYWSFFEKDEEARSEDRDVVRPASYPAATRLVTYLLFGLLVLQVPLALLLAGDHNGSAWFLGLYASYVLVLLAILWLALYRILGGSAKQPE
jgi:hypothetical protein